MHVIIRVMLFIVLFAKVEAQGAPFDDCADHLPFGAPTLTGKANTTPLCHAGYALLHDDDFKVPRWVAYKLTGKHSLGCLKRTNNFHVEDDLAEGHRATPADYRNSKPKYDRGHQAPAQDFAWNADLLSDTFSMANMAPQLPGLNQQGWLRLEETVRAWALERGTVIVYVGPVVLKTGPVIGPNKVRVPVAFWKVAIDPKSREAIAFRMPQQKIAKGDLTKWKISVADIEQLTGLTLPLPDGVDREADPPLWPANLSTWNAKKRAACSSKAKSS
ncbi:MAG: endonuclease mitochondrial [Bradyrhizobium sp.]|nr:endonuclease mitochondrial [Bradyrhizobium sp.]